MKLNIVTLLLVVGSFSAQSSESSTYDKICQMAADNGFSSAKNFAKKNDVFISKNDTRFSCNGVPIKQYAKKLKQSETRNTVKVVAKESNKLNNICVEALNKNVKAMTRKSAEVKAVQCNGVSVSEFVKQNES